MTNAELIAGLRECATVGDCSKCKMHDEYSYDMCAIKLLLAAADALEAGEKRIEELMPKGGEWEERYIEDANPMFRRRFYCSRCGDWTTHGKTRYCPNCGAKMKGERNEQQPKRQGL